MEVFTVMSPDPITVAPDAPLDQAMQTMEENRIRHLPVVEGDRLVGVVSERDLLVATGWLPAEQRPGEPVRDVRDVMHREVATVTPETSLVGVSVEMIIDGIGCLPVARDGELVGMVTETDLLRAYAQACETGRLPAEDNPPVSKCMSTNVASVSLGTTLKEARERCIERHVRHLPVVEGERLVGILSDRDLRRAIGRGESDAKTIDQLMTTEPLAADPDLPMSSAARILFENGISSLPVVRDGALAGIITSTDVIDRCLNTLWQFDEREG